LRRAVLLNGLIRTPDRFCDFLDGISALGAPDLRVILSTWTGELDAYPGVRARLERLGAMVAEQAPPDLRLPGHILHQAISLDLGLSLLDDVDFVFKARPDICNIWDVREFLDVSPEALPKGRLASPFSHRVLTVGQFAAHPLYINDIIFAGVAGDLRRLALLPLIAGVKYPRLAPEQWLWSTALLGTNPVLDAFLSVNPGLVFDDPGRNTRLRQVLAAAPLFARVVAVNAILVRDCLGFLHPEPHRDAIMAQASRHTLDALLWDRLDIPGLDPHALAGVNTFLTAGLMDVVHDGLHRSSDLGERVRAAMQRYGGPGGADWMAQDRAMLQREAASLAQSLEAQCGIGDAQAMEDRPGQRRVHRGASPWQQTAGMSDERARLEQEVNQLRRLVETLSQRITLP
jgi:hypothetical protein